jgi:hypothetical protein
VSLLSRIKATAAASSTVKRLTIKKETQGKQWVD